MIIEGIRSGNVSRHGLGDGMIESKEVFAKCGKCKKSFSLGCVVPCPIDVLIAAGKAARCPECGEKKEVYL